MSQEPIPQPELPQIAHLTATLRLTSYGKHLISESMYKKGLAFIGAYVLLSDQPSSEPVEYVRLHLLCQGIELLLKGLLLTNDYDKYKPTLAKKLGHNLTKCVDALTEAYAANEVRPNLRKELQQLDDFYKAHRLRYGSGTDLLITPYSITHKLVARRIMALIILTERIMKTPKNRPSPTDPTSTAPPKPSPSELVP